MASRIKDSFARQLSLPTKGVWGWITYNFLKRKHAVLERNAARLCAIEPHHKVLELGFGPGVGLWHAQQYVKDGPGKVHGIDLSSYMVEKASAQLRKPIQEGKVELRLGNVMDIPYGTDTFHRIFHCNCYYFWPNLEEAMKEIYRVMKPGSFMVTMLNLDFLQNIQAKGLLKYGNPDPVKYMSALELSGFQDVRMEYFKEGHVNYQAIFADLPVKPAVESYSTVECKRLDQEEKEHLDTASDLSQKGVHVSQRDSSSPQT